MSQNAISEIEEGAFDSLPLLIELDLSYNSLTNNIPWKDVSELPSLQALHLDGNKWNCSCELSSWLLNLSSVLVNSKAVCEYPTKLKGTLLHQLTRWNFLDCFSVNSLIIDLLDQVYYVLPFVVLSISALIMFSPYLRSNLVKFNRIEYDPKDVLGGKNNVFKGKFRDGNRYRRDAAIKVHRQKLEPKEIEILLCLQEGPPHPNVMTLKPKLLTLLLICVEEI